MFVLPISFYKGDNVQFKEHCEIMSLQPTSLKPILHFVTESGGGASYSLDRIDNTISWQCGEVEKQQCSNSIMIDLLLKPIWNFLHAYYFHRCLSVHSGGGGSLYDVTVRLAAWSQSVSGPMFHPGGQKPPTPWTVKSGRYASYWNAFLLYFQTVINAVRNLPRSVRSVDLWK